MSFLNFPLLALGTLALAGPIILHLMMQRKPKPQIFPALRFIQKKHVTNSRKLRLRQWALLALRCAAVLGLGIALAKPVIASAGLGTLLLGGSLGLLAILVGALSFVASQRGQGTWLATILAGIAATLLMGAMFLGWQAVANDQESMLLGDSEAPVAAVMIFDTSPRMALVHESKSRLDEAKLLGKWLLRQLPSDSRVAVVDTQLGGSHFSPDRISAAGEIDALSTGAWSQPLGQVMESARRLLVNVEEQQTEIYIFSDLTQPSWRGERSEETEDETNPPQVYIVDVGVEKPQNLSLGNVELSRQHITRNNKLRLRISLESQGLAATRNVELFVETPNPNLPIILNGKPKLPKQELKDQRAVSIAQDESQELEFSLRGLPVGIHHGEIRLTGSDGLACDDARFFSIEVHPPWKVLLATGAGAEPRFVRELLAPYRYRETGQAMFACDVIEATKLETVNLDEYAAVMLLDPGPLQSVGWRILGDYVQRGHGLAVFLGRNANADLADFTSQEALAVLPGRIKRVWRSGVDDILLAFGADQHPILRVLEPIATTIPWDRFPIERHWLVDQVTPAGRVIMRFGTGKPALLEGTLGSGQVIMMTTPVSDALNVRGRKPWNRGTDSWPYVVLVNEIAKYLVQGIDSRLNYDVGETASVNTDAKADPDNLQLFHPRGTWQEVQSNRGLATVPVSDTPGTYRLRTNTKTDTQLGFSVNLRAADSNLDRIDEAGLANFFPNGNYQLARNKEAIDRSIGIARSGHQFYPWVVLFVVLLLALEHLLSNLFYGPMVIPQHATT